MLVGINFGVPHHLNSVIGMVGYVIVSRHALLATTKEYCSSWGDNVA
jgi:hypothetical protein